MARLYPVSTWSGAKYFFSSTIILSTGTRLELRKLLLSQIEYRQLWISSSLRSIELHGRSEC